MDITDADSIEKGLAQAVENGPISFLVNSAGVVANPLLIDLEESDWDKVLDTNLKGSWLLSKAVALQMIEAGWAEALLISHLFWELECKRAQDPICHPKLG